MGRGGRASRGPRVEKAWQIINKRPLGLTLWIEKRQASHRRLPVAGERIPAPRAVGDSGFCYSCLQPTAGQSVSFGLRPTPPHWLLQARGRVVPPSGGLRGGTQSHMDSLAPGRWRRRRTEEISAAGDAVSSGRGARRGRQLPIWRAGD